MKYTISILLLLSSLLSEIGAQPKCAFTHYSVEDGLSEGVVLSMHQDREGFIWFGTFDGLNRFDGYNFKVYKAGFTSDNVLKNNRVDRIVEDDLGYLWIMAYEGDIYRLNTRTEVFTGFSEISNESPENYSPVRQIYCFSGGETWLSTQSGKCVRIISSPSSPEYNLTSFKCGDGAETGININTIHKDRLNNVWILTTNGLWRLSPGSSSPENISPATYDRGKSLKGWYCVHESPEKIWFGSSEGTICVMDQQTGIFESIDMGVRSDIVAIETLNQREMIILTSDDGFFVYNPLTGDKKQFNREKNPVLPTNKMVSVYVDRFGEAWIETSSDGVTHYDPFNGIVRHFRMKVDKTNPNVLLPSFVIFEDKNDNLWIYPRGGGFSFYDRAERKLQYFFNEPGSDARRFPNLIHSAISDLQGNLWICTIYRGIEKVTFFPNQFKILQPKYEAISHSENEVRALFEDKNRLLWVATRDGFVYLYDSARVMTGKLRTNGSFKSGEDFNALVYSITQDRRGNIWMGSKGRGIFKLEPSGEKSGYRYRITNYRNNPEDPYSLSHDNVYSVFEDANGRIWVGTFNGGLNYITEDSDGVKFIKSFNLLKNYPYANHRRVRYITSDFNNNIWVGTTNGILIFNQDFDDPSAITFRSCSFDPGDETSLANNDVHYIYCSEDKEIYAATFGGGLNKVINPDFGEGKPLFKSFTVSTGAPDDVILSIVDDTEGNLWLSSERGILKFNKKNESFEIYGEQSGVDRRYFSEATGIRTRSKEIMFGFDNGIYYFNPGQINKMNYIPPILITRVTASGNEVNNDEMFPYAHGAADSDFSLSLNNKQKTLTIEYSALDYRNPRNIQYARMMEGFDEDWLIDRGIRTSTYNNLAPGDYVFRVKSTNADGIWVDNERTINLTVHPSFWQTALAKILVILLILILIAVTIYIILTFYKLRHKVEVEQLFTNLKLKFFTDISHELRTPLTLISSPVGNILKHNSLQPEVREQLNIVQSNTERMLRLVNQILDFRKIQSRKMSLKIEEFALGSYICEICSNFRKIAEDKGIRLSVNDDSGGETVWADKDKVEKIVYNLLSNALKFTPRGKQVTVTVRRINDTIELEVADQGTGLSKEKMKNLFMRFNSNEGPVMSFQPGTGIGLSLSKELADLHKAELKAESREGEGATFRVIFKLGFGHFENDTEFVLKDSHNAGSGKINSAIFNEEEDEFSEDEGSEDNEPVLLFVEDNEELRSFLRIILADGFHVIEASNGNEGFEIAKSQLPDIIITDLMMPEKNGLELAREIKADETTSHIPVVVLTAKTDLDTQVEALKTGADDFITKPFSSTYLRAKIENILQQRRKLQEIFVANLPEYNARGAKKIIEINPSAPVIESHDDKLMKRLMVVMETNIDNSALTVDELVSGIGIGRSVFFKKLKSITGLAPIEFIREVRVKRAAQLIETGEYTISQVTYMVGCNDPRYFSRIFKQRFGVTPSEYREKYTRQK
ncbi:MAG: hybrid sensor histidine kinase/response regulator [Bacteroidia bacterium]|nr:MAG: hybrid sensor histidine kinase/response regulator [Bacteroidia bacterium]